VLRASIDQLADVIGPSTEGVIDTASKICATSAVSETPTDKAISRKLSGFPPDVRVEALPEAAPVRMTSTWV